MKQLSRNLLSIALGDLGSRLLGFVATAYLARTLQPESFGLLSVGLAVYGYLLFVASPGLQLFGARAAAQTRGNEVELTAEIVGIRIFLSLCCVLIAAVISLVCITDATLSLVVVLYAISLVPISLLLDWFLQGKEVMAGIGWSRIATNLVYILMVVALVHSPMDVSQAPAAFFVGNSVGAVALIFWFWKRYGTFRIQWRPSELFSKSGRWYQTLRSSLPIGFGAIMGQVSYNLPPILLGLWATMSDAGYYSAALKVVFFLMLFDRLVTTLLFPAVARYQQFAPDQLGALLRVVLKWMLIVIVPITIGGMLVGERLLGTIFGAEFLPAVPVFQVLVWFFFFSASTSTYAFGLIGIGEERTYARMIGWGTIVHVVSIGMGVWTAGPMGAAAGYVVGEAATLFLLARSFSRHVDVGYWSALWRPFIAAVAMAGIVYPLASWTLFVSVPVGALAFFFVLFIVRGIRMDDLSELKARFV